MARSEAFAKMKTAILDAVCALEYGMLTSSAELARAHNVPPRHVAYIISQLNKDEMLLVPWWRVVPNDGKFDMNSARAEKHKQQISLLEKEGHIFDGPNLVSFRDKQHQFGNEHISTIWAEE